MRLVHNTWTEQRQGWNIILQLLAMRTSLRQRGVSVDQIWWTSRMTNMGKKSWRISNLYGGHRAGMIQTSCHYRLVSVSDSIISLFRLCVRLHHLSFLSRSLALRGKKGLKSTTPLRPCVQDVQGSRWVSMRSEKPTCAPPRLPDVFPPLLLRRFQCLIETMTISRPFKEDRTAVLFPHFCRSV